MIIHSKTDIGKSRSSNQDAYFAASLTSGAVFAIVCDGMGGANAGNVASETAVKIISEYVLHSYRLDMDSFDISKMLKNAIISANIEIYEMSQKNPELNGMGTTVVAVLVNRDKAVVINVGDSRAYHIGEELTQITKDHSVVQSLIESGKITSEDAKVHPSKNVITRALGAEENVVTDSYEVTLSKESKLLICSDGLSSFAEEEEILNIFKSAEKEDITDELIELANNGGGGDNITVVTLAMEE